MAKAWMRQIQIILTSTTLKKRITFGANSERSGDDLTIVVTGTKYLSALKDEFMVRITNLTYAEITQLISGKYYDIEIKAGYQTAGLHTVFKGGVLYITNVLGDRKSNECIIFCASQMIARFGQNRMNLGLNSGINMFSALNFIARRAGIPNSNVDEQFKARILRESESVATTASSWLDAFCQTNGFVINADNSMNATFNVFDPYRKDQRLIKLNSSTIILTSGYPTLTSEGLNLCLMPTFNFMCGDTIQIDNSIIDIGSTNKDAYKENVGFYIDVEGKYMIYQIEYSLCNRSSDFSLKMLCKARSLMSKLAGGR